MLNRSDVYERGKHVINKVCLKSYVAITLIIMIKLIKLLKNLFSKTQLTFDTYFLVILPMSAGVKCVSKFQTHCLNLFIPLLRVITDNNCCCVF